MRPVAEAAAAPGEAVERLGVAGRASRREHPAAQDRRAGPEDLLEQRDARPCQQGVALGAALRRESPTQPIRP